MSGWSADNAGSTPPAAGHDGSVAPAAEPPTWSAPESPAAAPAAWAMPESEAATAAQAASALASPAGTTTAPDGGWTSGPDPIAPPRLPVALRAMTATDIVDGAWGVIKARPKTVFAITAVIILPIEIVAAFLAQGSVAALDVAASTFDSPSSGRVALGGAGVLLAQLVQNLGPFLLGAAIARLVSSWYAGGDMTARQAVTAAFRKAPALLGAFAMLIPVKLIGWIPCGLALPFIIPLFMVTAPAIVIEDLGPWSGVKRAFDLARRRYWPCVGVWGLAFLVEMLVNVALGLLPSILSGFVPSGIAPVVSAAGAVFAAFITKPFVVAVAVLLYLDLRVRTEGLDLELEANAAFTRAA